MKRIVLSVLLMFPVFSFAKPLKIGVSLHPYYSFVKNIVQDKAEVIPLIDGVNNPHNYQPRPKDVERAMTLDAVVLNGIGHDEFAIRILQSAGVYNKILKILANDRVPLISQTADSKKINSHTFISFNSSIIQIYTIADKLGELDPQNSKLFKENARNYIQKLRDIKKEYADKILKYPKTDLKCATVHGGYTDLLNEFGFSVEAVIESSHGVNPTASQFKSAIDKIKTKGVKVIFSENDYPSGFVSAIKKETGISIVTLSHLSGGMYSDDYFEKGMQYNLDKLLISLNEINNIPTP